MIEIIRPMIETEEQNNGAFGRFVVEPLERGFGTTIGNAMRRILLSALPGAAAVGIKIDGVQHEFSQIEGVREDVAEIILNLKGVAFKAHFTDKDEKRVVYLNKSEPGPVTAADIKLDADVEILNPDHYLCYLEQGASINAEIYVGQGRGYVPADANKSADNPVGYIATDSIFTPVVAASYYVENTRVGQSIDYDKLTIEVKTNGTTSAREVISLSAKLMNEHIRLFIGLIDGKNGNDIGFSPEEEKQTKILEMQIEDMELSARSYNCLKRAGINFVQDLTKKTYDELMKVRNLGQKSAEEIKAKLEELGLSLRSKDD
jgi:DNA-directed RNA polymerase subunit alpha